MLLEGQSAEDNEDSKDLAELQTAAGKGDGTEDTAAIPEPPEPAKPVVLAQPKSRRAQAEEDRKAEIAKLSDSMKELRDGLSARDRQIGELTGHLSALSQQRQAQVYQPPQQQAPNIPDPEDLLAKANERLDARDMTGYHRLLLQANQAATMRAMAPVMHQMQQQRAQPQEGQIPGALMPYFAAYPDVASHPRVAELLAAKNSELAIAGYREGPERVKAVFEAARAFVQAQNGGAAKPSFDRGSAAALSGTPTARPSGGSAAAKGEPRVELTKEEQFYWKKAGFTDENELAQNIAKARPERIVR